MIRNRDNHKQEPVGPHRNVWRIIIEAALELPEACQEILDEAVSDMFHNVNSMGRKYLTILLSASFCQVIFIYFIVCHAAMIMLIPLVIYQIVIQKYVRKTRDALGWRQSVEAIQAKDIPDGSPYSGQSGVDWF